MKSRLDKVDNWPELARECGYQAKPLAARCEVSPRTLQRFFRSTNGKTPQKWLNELRQRIAASAIKGSKSVKEIAHELGYKQPSHFSREFKRFHGVPPGFYKPYSAVAEKYEMSLRDTQSNFKCRQSFALMQLNGKGHHMPAAPLQLQLPFTESHTAG